ncbi:ImmA/IrrE family metallo-endopeptidase [Prescottella defluvii]|nr:ImmA/IrrE family metallo-endopeptidase [Prescottella defluvii]
MNDVRWTAKQAADLVINALRTPDGRISYPIDPVTIARDLGINVYSAKLDNSLSGMIVKASANDGAEIFLNSEHAPVRQRFTCAHELGHYFHNFTPDGERMETYLHRRDARSACGTHSEEIYANQFAANLLMPSEVVKDLAVIHGNAVSIADSLQVSLDAIGIRLNSLGIRV